MIINNKINEKILYYKLKACLKRYAFTWYLKFDRESRLEGRITECSTTNCWEYLDAWNLKHNFFAGSEGISC